MCYIEQFMKKKKRTYTQVTKQALILLGKQVQLARKQRRMTETELADRVGISRTTLRHIEAGAVTVEVGLVFEAAVIVGVPLLTENLADLPRQLSRFDDKLALLPQSIRKKEVKVMDDF